MHPAIGYDLANARITGLRQQAQRTALARAARHPASQPRTRQLITPLRLFTDISRPRSFVAWLLLIAGMSGLRGSQPSWPRAAIC